MILFNGNPLSVTMFPDRTSQVWKLNDQILNTTNYAHITWHFENEGEFMHLAQLQALLQTKGFTTCLRLSYLPYARQDKAISNTSTFALNVFAHMLNALHFDEVIIMDPHSQDAIKMIYNSRAEYPVDTVLYLFDEYEHNLLCYPDKGALSKYTEIYKCSYMYGEKVRDQLTGHITSYEIKGQSVAGQKVLIVDDICDGGMTFILLAKDLLKAGAIEVNLFVTHGIFSKGLKPLFDSGINKIFTKDGEVSEVQGNLAYEKL